MEFTGLSSIIENVRLYNPLISIYNCYVYLIFRVKSLKVKKLILIPYIRWDFAGRVAK